AFDTATTRVQVADDRSHKFFGNRNLDIHHRLEQNGLRLASSFLEGHGTSDLERHFVRVDVVIASVVQRNLNVNPLVAGKHAASHRVLNTLVDRLDVLLGDHAALDVIRELVTLARLVG